MAKLSKEEVEEIIERDLPNYQIVRQSGEDVVDRDDFSRFRDSGRQRSISDATSPNLDTLREKLKQRGERLENSDRNSLDHMSDDIGEADDAVADDMIVAVRPKKTDSPYDTGYRTKAVVISGRSKKVIGRQG